MSSQLCSNCAEKSIFQFFIDFFHILSKMILIVFFPGTTGSIGILCGSEIPWEGSSNVCSNFTWKVNFSIFFELFFRIFFKFLYRFSSLELLVQLIFYLTGTLPGMDHHKIVHIELKILIFHLLWIVFVFFDNFHSKSAGKIGSLTSYLTGTFLKMPILKLFILCWKSNLSHLDH